LLKTRTREHVKRKKNARLPLLALSPINRNFPIKPYVANKYDPFINNHIDVFFTLVKIKTNIIMKKIYTSICTVALLFACLCSNAQLTPQPSSTQTIAQGFGLGKINLVYSRPNVKGRKIFGGMEPYGTVWRTGANSATVIKFSDDVTMDGKKIPAGEYGLFSIPGENEWTIIISKQPKQWGAYSYKEADDFLRFTVKTEHLAALTETMTLAFTDVAPTTCNLQMMWEHSGFTIHLTTDIDTKVMARIDSAMKTDKKPYYEAIIYYYNNNKDMTKALAWANELEKDKKFPPYVPKLWKARVLLKKGDKATAITTAEEGVKAAEAAKTPEYVMLNSEVIKQAKK
jgi:hypothetical protein